MSKTANGVSLFMAVSSIFLIDFGWGLKFTVSPAVVSAIVPADISLSCELDASDVKGIRNSKTASFAKLQAMGIAQDAASSDQSIAVVRVSAQAVTLDSSIKATGYVQEDGRNSYLDAKITGLQLNQAINMTCFTYVLSDHILKQITQKIAVKEEIDFALKLGHRQAKEALQESRIKLVNQKRILDGVILRHGRSVRFRALMIKGHTYPISRIVFFRKVVYNVGRGYNPSTGKFKAPYTGYYLFDVGWYVNINTWLYIDIKTRSRVLTRIGGMAFTWRNYAEGSVVAKLDKGEEVYPFVSGASSTGDPAAEFCGSSGSINHFSGYLMKSL